MALANAQSSLADPQSAKSDLLRPRGNVTLAAATNRGSHLSRFLARNGDGGNRTHVRGRVKGGVSERSRRSDLALDSPRRRGCRGPAPKDVLGSAGADLTERAC